MWGLTLLCDVYFNNYTETCLKFGAGSGSRRKEGRDGGKTRKNRREHWEPYCGPSFGCEVGKNTCEPMIKELWPFYLKVLLHIAPSRRKTDHFFNTLHHAISGSVNPEASALYRAKYRQHNARVQAVIPAERLLVYNVKQGWKPLCEFLRCDVPSTPFPRANVGHSGTKSQMTEQIEEHKNEAFKLITYIFVFAMCLLATFLMLYVIG